jgi:hypothetical protein
MSMMPSGSDSGFLEGGLRLIVARENSEATPTPGETTPIVLERDYQSNRCFRMNFR